DLNDPSGQLTGISFRLKDSKIEQDTNGNWKIDLTFAYTGPQLSAYYVIGIKNRLNDFYFSNVAITRSKVLGSTDRTLSVSPGTVNLLNATFHATDTVLKADIGTYTYTISQTICWKEAGYGGKKHMGTAKANKVVNLQSTGDGKTPTITG